MRPGPPRGTTEARRLVVTAAMATPASGNVAATYGSPSMAEHVVLLGRALVEPHLEDGEEAIDVALEIRHREPIPVGEQIELEATVASVEPNRVVCEVMVRHHGTTVARATLEQAVVDGHEFTESVRKRTNG